VLTPLPPPPPRDLGPRLQRLGAQAGAVVLLGLFSFGVAGLVVDTGDDGPGDVAAASPGPTIADSGSPSATLSDGASAAVTETPTPTPTPTPTLTPSPTPTPTVAETPSAQPSASETDDGRIDPSSVSIQVLDGVRDDDRAAARKVADKLTDAGYRVVVINPASSVYDVTTVLWTQGFEDQALQVQHEFSFAEAREKPSNLSSNVQLHVVVGRDQR